MVNVWPRLARCRRCASPAAPTFAAASRWRSGLSARDARAELAADQRHVLVRGRGLNLARDLAADEARAREIKGELRQLKAELARLDDEISDST